MRGATASIGSLFNHMGEQSLAEARPNWAVGWLDPAAVSPTALVDALSSHPLGIRLIGVETSEACRADRVSWKIDPKAVAVRRRAL